MKSRGGLICAHCRTHIPAGVSCSRYAGGIWRTDHLIAYQKERRERLVGARPS
jgi:hypothetical protein